MISLIVAAARNGVIGRDNRLPWRLPADLKQFKSRTLGHPVIMGRKTFESIGRPLPQRTNIVITRQSDYYANGIQIAHSLPAALSLAQGDEEIFIIGGAEIYEQALPLAGRIYLTRIHHDFEGDAYLFDIDQTTWREVERLDCLPDEKNKYAYSFITLKK